MLDESVRKVALLLCPTHGVAEPLLVTHVVAHRAREENTHTSFPVLASREGRVRELLADH